jgi:cellobiose phosphorylase
MAFAAMGNSDRAWELFSMINPVNHSSSPEGIATYKVEPYVMAADIYAVAPHVGRGGWTWYTGSAGWMYRLITESLLGLYLEVDKLRFAPCVPAAWSEFKIHYRFRETVYHITVSSAGAESAVSRLVLDGADLSDGFVTLVDDGQHHEIKVNVAVASESASTH